MTQQDTINALVAQLDKARGEIVAEIKRLEDQIGTGEPLDFTALKERVQALDDVVPDKPDQPDTPDQPETPDQPGPDQPSEPGPEQPTEPGTDQASAS
ncbi:hypothetical protein [Nocardia transvalensis]|uniref:hypothetical protein n=1 Tax=Nocardia transvalensis TaxID=37333 RepID=UPI00189534B2|nr:hypothetical protein [Nocardia transvalensis]MBF6333323.1 hypothetical protein [Nocardia transvalensis]